MRAHRIAGALCALALLPPGLAQAGELKDVKVGGKIYAEYGRALDEANKNANSFDIKRVYLTTKAKLTDTLSTRVTTDVGRASDGKYYLFLKYAYLEWRSPLAGTKFRFGAAGLGWAGFYDKFWGKRWIAKSFTDDNRLLATSDLGVHAVGKHMDGLLSWQASVVNGSGYGNAEDDKAKTAQLRLTLDPLHAGEQSLPVSVFASQDVGADSEDAVRLLAGAVGWKKKGLASAWGEYVMEAQDERSGAGMSATVVADVAGLFEVLGRFDKWDPDTDTDDDGVQRIRAGVSKNFAKKVAAAVVFEQAKNEADDDPTQGVFVRMLGGF